MLGHTLDPCQQTVRTPLFLFKEFEYLLSLSLTCLTYRATQFFLSVCIPMVEQAIYVRFRNDIHRPIHVHACIYTHTHTYLYLATDLPSYLPNDLSTYLPTYVPTYLRTYLHVYIQYMHACIHTYIIYTYIIHTYIIHTYMVFPGVSFFWVISLKIPTDLPFRGS